MNIGILGKKLGMTQVFGEDGRMKPVTLIEAGPCPILEMKSKERDGYVALQLGFEDQKEARTNKPALGRFKKAGISPKKWVKEIRIEVSDQYKVGQTLTAEIFQVGEFLDVTGTTKGKDFREE